MKLTALLIEPTLIGLAVLAAIALAVSPWLDAWLIDDKVSNLVIVSAVAYFLGITFDRTADTILNRLLVAHRLKFVRKKLQEKEQATREGPRDDPFPEDLYQVRIAQGPAAWEHLSYHRSRIRLTRAFLVLAPALSLGAAIRLANEAPWLRWSAVAVMLFIYALVFIGRSGEELPRTADPPEKIDGAFNLEAKPQWRFIRINDKETLGLAAGLALVSAFVMFWGSLLPPPSPAGYGRAAGYAVALLAGTLAAIALLFSSWWRITETYFAFLWNHERLALQKAFILD